MIVPFTAHGWINTAHGVLFGGSYLALLVLALVAVALLRPGELTPFGLRLTERQVGALVVSATAAAWVVVVIGTWVLYPWFKAGTPESAASALLARPSLAFWARWVIVSKEGAAWASTGVVTLASVAGYRWRRRLAGDGRLRRRLVGLLGLALLGASYAAAVGMLLAKLAPVR